MGVNFAELTDEERATRQLRLLNELQVANLTGSWESQTGSEIYFWSDSMFTLHGLEPAPDNLIKTEDAHKFIHRDDIATVLEKRRELGHSSSVEYNLRIVTTEGHIRRIFARESIIHNNGSSIIRGLWQDERRYRDMQQPLRDLAEKQAMQLNVFERAEEVALAGSWQINLESFETIYSDSVYRIYGLAPQSVPAHVDSFRKYIHPEDRSIVLKAHERAYVEMIPLHLEYRIVRDDGEVRYISQVSHLVKNEKGEHILSGSTRDTTDQKLLEIQIRESNDLLALYNELFVQAEQIGKMGTWQINLETRKNIYSDNLYRLFGVKPHAAPAAFENFIQFIHPDDRQWVTEVYRSIFDEKKPFEIVFRVTRADGKQRVVLNKSKLVKNSSGELVMTGVIQDITEQKEKDRQLKESSEKIAIQNESFKLSEAIAGIGSWTWNLDTDEMMYSDNVYAIYGLKPQSVSPGFENFGKYMHPDDRKWMKEMPGKIRQSLETTAVQYRIIRPDGTIRYLYGRSQPITSPDGHTIIIGTTQDITEDVLIKQQLLEKVQFSEMLSNSIVDRIMVTDVSNNIIGWNKSCERIYKKSKEEVVGRNVFDVFPMIKNPAVIDRFKKALAGEIIHVPVQHNAEIGGYHELFMVPFRNKQGAVSGVISILHDVTYQQELQEQLGARLQFIEKLLESSVDRIIALDNNLYFQLWNKQCEQYYGYPQEKVIGKNILEIFPRFKADPLHKHCLRALEGETVYVPADENAGYSGYQESYFIPIKNEAKQITGLLWIMHDLTERFLAEEKLRNSETHLRTAQEIAVMGSFEVDLSTGKMHWSDQTYSIFDYPHGDDIDFAKVTARIHPEDVPEFNEIFNAEKRQAGEIFDTYFRIMIGDRVKYIHSRNQVVGDADGKKKQVIGTMQDISEKMQAQEVIIKQQELLKQAEAIAHVGSWELDNSTNAIVWSDEVFRIYGYAPQVFEPTLDFYLKTIHANDRPELKQAIHNAKKDSRLFTLTCRIFTLDGELRYLQVRGRGVANAAGKLSRVVGTMEDITEQKQMEEELRRKTEAMRFQ